MIFKAYGRFYYGVPNLTFTCAPKCFEYISNPSRDGYKFLGWDIALPETMPAEDFTITALWEKDTEEA